uniref:SUMO-activating enzyme subunit 1 n=1 Tax=Panagrolaimus superbus TaxID=310955 RepID=A0A914Z6C3_9BILA
MAQNGETKQELSDVLDVNLYSRQIYALGQTAMFRLRSANVLVSGIGSVGVEVAKNLVLGGVRHVTLHDTKNVSWNDLSAQYYLHEDDIGKNRADACFSKIEELNDSVTCSLSTEPLTHDLIKKFNVIVLTDSDILFIYVDIAGLFGYVFADLGDAFRIDDVDGEPPKEVWLENINTTNGDVPTLDGALHGLETDKSVFNIGDVAVNFGEYTEGGRAKQVKMPFEVKYKSLEESITNPTFLEWDFMKFESPSQLHTLFQALYKNEQQRGNRPTPYALNDSNDFGSNLVSEVPEEFRRLFAYTSCGNLQPLASIVGGISAQEAVKAITHHTTPLNGFLYIDNVEWIPLH